MGQRKTKEEQRIEALCDQRKFSTTVVYWKAYKILGRYRDIRTLPAIITTDVELFREKAICNGKNGQKPPQALPDDPEGIRISLVRRDIAAYIANHYTEELSMKNAAHAMNYSDAYFCKLFKQCFHVNFSTYLNEYRIEKARALMQNPRINIKDISIACGYSDPNYFTRVFKRLTGLTPTEYRLSCLNQE